MNTDNTYKNILKTLANAPGSDFKVKYEDSFLEKIVHIPTGYYFFTNVHIVTIYNKNRSPYPASLFQWLLNCLLCTEKKIINKIKGK
jgi:hypothetical protein